ncbi:MAG: flagellar hook-associated protein FlgK [Gammaproteobacteria bacterium]|nr:flagellar hook-associated protein FlgK [Gammaproteobacteria bacterium]
MAVTGNPLNVGISGLLSSQRSLAVVSHNVSNVNTDGYSRQRAIINSREPSYSGAGYIGNGSNVVDTRRLYDSFLQNQLQVNVSSGEYHSVDLDYASQLDNLLADVNAGLTPAVQSFFEANQGVTDDPTSVPARQVMLTEGEALVSRFHIINDRMQDLRENINLELRNVIPEINSIAEELASLNEAIAGSPGRANGILPNDLLDRRDQALVELAEYVNVQTVEQSNGSLNVYIGNGQGIVTDFKSNALTIEPNVYDSSEVEVGYTIGANQINISTLISGGKLGALLNIRDELLDPIQNSLGRIAFAMEDTYNAQHRLGMDLNSELGGDFFSVGTPEVLPSVNNTGAANITATISDTNLLTDSDYRLSYDGANYTLTRLSDNTVEATFAPGALPYTSADGFIIDNAGGAPVAGDSFLIRPTRPGARTIDAVIDDTAKIAVASPVAASADLNNIGTGKVNSVTVTDTTGAEFTTTALTLTPEIAVVFDAVNPNEYDVLQVNPPGPNLVTNAVYNPATGLDVVADNALGFGYEINITGNPGLNDRFDISYNLNGVSDNNNGLALSSLQTTSTMLNGTASYLDAYGSMVTSVGTHAHQADIANNAQQTLLRQARNAREEVSGVNLDEEASDMLRFQQAYQAAAQVISAANSTFDELIAAVRS